MDCASQFYPHIHGWQTSSISDAVVSSLQMYYILTELGHVDKLCIHLWLFITLTLHHKIAMLESPTLCD